MGGAGLQACGKGVKHCRLQPLRFFSDIYWNLKAFMLVPVKLFAQMTK